MRKLILLLPFAAGGFIYIATSDLIPELHKEESLEKASLNFWYSFSAWRSCSA